MSKVDQYHIRMRRLLSAELSPIRTVVHTLNEDQKHIVIKHIRESLHGLLR